MDGTSSAAARRRMAAGQKKRLAAINTINDTCRTRSWLLRVPGCRVGRSNRVAYSLRAMRNRQEYFWTVLLGVVLTRFHPVGGTLLVRPSLQGPQNLALLRPATFMLFETCFVRRGLHVSAGVRITGESAARITSSVVRFHASRCWDRELRTCLNC